MYEWMAALMRCCLHISVSLYDRNVIIRCKNTICDFVEVVSGNSPFSARCTSIEIAILSKRVRNK